VCHKVVILAICFLKAHINNVLEIFENVRVLAYSDDLKLCMRVSSTDDCRIFQGVFDRMYGWCCKKKYDLNTGKCKFNSKDRKPVLFKYIISNNSDLERVDEINDFRVLIDNKWLLWITLG
jgi:hypothetical protein